MPQHIARMKPTPPTPKSTSDRLTTVLSYGTLLLLIYLVYRITEPFLVPLAWSAVLAIFFYPMYERIEKRMNPTQAALVSTVPLNVKARGGRGDARRTLRICALLIDDRDEMIVKALSWAHRALIERDGDAVRQFLKENEARLPALVRREVQNKLTAGRKSPSSSHRKVRA